MYHEFILELKSMRLKSGLSQEDCALLLGVSATIFGRIERGDRPPTVEEICCLQLLFGKTFENFYATCVGDARDRLREKLPSVPKLPEDDCDHLARQLFLEGLATRLETNPRHDGR
ncbi:MULTISPECIES: helix-turn-helix transcriptional regulator [Roseobacteraceae]|uniref:helix-turn-helix transcriptional regulator n=1 Tax=Roseobacteraceae TaxID=2854170 RepID=UPI002B27B8A7|nr:MULTISPECIES: helix-turn-helix transcriptional regulator [Roseobacteraceae]